MLGYLSVPILATDASAPWGGDIFFLLLFCFIFLTADRE
jgi:hypothetical protein